MERRRGFTLVELLVSIAIIAILAGMVLGAISMSQASAREAKTRSLIVTLNNIIMEEWDSYRTRRLPVTMTAAERAHTAGGITQFATRQLTARREMMRMEMPDRWSDIVDDPVSLPAVPAKAISFRRKLTPAIVAHPRFHDEQDAECLYLVVESLRSDEATEILKRHSADTDGDGLLEIVDGWGRPIRWLRWPVGFVDDPDDPLDPSDTVEHRTDLNDENTHDPFDPRRLHPGAFLVMPLIYSAGPDGQYDIIGDFVDTSGKSDLHYRDTYATFNNNPYRVDPLTGLSIGSPGDFAGDGLGHFDNIHNHLGLTR